MSTTLTKKSKFPTFAKWLIVAVVLCMIGAMAYYFLKPKEAPPAYLTAEAVMGDIESSVLASGKVKAIKSVDVGAEVSGRIVKLYVDVGDEVKKGDKIAEISQVEKQNTLSNANANLLQARASLAQAEANLASAQGSVVSAQSALNARLAELKKAEQALARLESLVAIEAVSRQDYDDAKIALEVAQANVETAQATLHNAKNQVVATHATIASQQASIAKAQNDLSTAKEDLNKTIIIAPMDGMVVSVSQKEGTTVNANQSAPTIVTLADLSQVRIKAQISEADVVGIKEGLPARFNIIGNSEQKFDATLTGIEPAPENISTTSSTDSAVYYIGYLDVDNSERKFRIDMTAQVNIITNSVKNVLTVPASALKKDKDGHSVQVVGEDGIAKPVLVQVGLNNRVNAEIKSGLTAGDKVVIGEASPQTGQKSQNRPPMMR